MRIFVVSGTLREARSFPAAWDHYSSPSHIVRVVEISVKRESTLRSNAPKAVPADNVLASTEDSARVLLETT